MHSRKSSTNTKVTELSPLISSRANKSSSNDIIEIVSNELEIIKESTPLFSTRYPRSSDLLRSLVSKQDDDIKTSLIERYIRDEGKITEAILTGIAEFYTKLKNPESSKIVSPTPSIAAESIKLLLNQDKEKGKKVGFNDLNELDVDKLKVILSRPTGLQAMFENKITFESLKELDADKLEVFLSHPDAIRMIYENTVTFEDLKDLDIEKLNVFLSHPDAVEIISKNGIKFDSLKELDTNKLIAFLSSEDGLRIMFESKVEIDSENEFEAVLLSDKDRLRKTLENKFKFDNLKELNADKIKVFLSHPNEIKKIFIIKDYFDKLKVLNSDKLEVCLPHPGGFGLMLENEVNFDSLNELDTEKLVVFLSHPNGLREMFKNNVSFDSLKELDTAKLEVFLSNTDGLRVMFKNEVAFESLKELDTDKLAVFLSRPHGLREMFKNKVNFDSLRELDNEKLEVFLSNTDVLRVMFKNEVAFESLKELDTDKLVMLMSYPRGLQKIFDNRINFNELKKLNTKKIELLLWHRNALQEMFNKRVSFEQIKSLDTSELEHLLVYSDESVAILTGSKAGFYRQDLGMLVKYMFSPQRDDDRIQLSVDRLQSFKSTISFCLEITHDDETLNRTDRDLCSDILDLLNAEQYASARNGIKNLFDSIERQSRRLFNPESIMLAKLHGKLTIALEEIDFNLLILEGMIKDNQYVNYEDYCRIDRSQPLNPTLGHLYRLIENNDFRLLHMLKHNHFQLNKLLKNKDGFLACIHGLEDDVRGRFISEFKAHFLNKNIGLDISCPPLPTRASFFRSSKVDSSVDFSREKNQPNPVAVNRR